MTNHVLKAWIVDNPLTTKDKTDKIFSIETARTVDNEVILDRMMAKNPGVRRETMALSLKLMEETVTEALMSGESVNTGLFHAVAHFHGKAKMNTWDAGSNSIRVSMTQGKALRESIKKTRVEILGERPSNFYINSAQDTATRAEDFSATAGRNFAIFGRNLTVVGEDPSVGITLTSVAKGTVTKIEKDRVVVNGPSKLIILLPANLKDGEYTLTVTTQYRNGRKQFLKKPHSVSHSIYIGKAPTGGGSSEQPGGSGGSGSGGEQGGNPLG